MKNCIHSLFQNRNNLFQGISYFSLIFLFLLTTNHLKSQTDTTSSYLIIPDTLHNANTMSPRVVINHSMIERFLTVSFPAGKMDFRNMMMTKSMDSIKLILQSEMRRNVEIVSGSETSSGDESTSENKLMVYPDSGIESSSD